jgi:MFS family permease
VSPAALALIAMMFTEPAERAKAMGLWGGIAGMGGALGVLLGGAFTDLLSWRWIFFINVPVGVAVIALLPRMVRRDAPGGARRFDLRGAVAVTGGLLALVYAILGAHTRGWGSALTVGLLVAAVLALAGFVLIERRHPTPMIPPRFFREPATRVANVLGLITPSAFAGMFFLLTLYLQAVLDYSPLRTGVAYLTLVAAMLIAIPLASARLLPNWGARPLLAAGLAIIAVGLLTLTRLPVRGDYWADVAPGLALVGFGAGWAFLSVTIAAVAKVSPAETGLASGMINAAQQVGGAVALAVYVSVASAVAEHAVRAGADPITARVAGYQSAFFVGAGIALVGAAIAAVGLRGLGTRRSASQH